MKQKKKKPKLYATTVTLALAAGVTAGVTSYRSGTQFQPSASSREIKENQVTFSEDGKRTQQGQSESQDNSALWEKDEQAQERSTMDAARDAAYLFEQAQNQLNNGNGQTNINLAQQNENQTPDVSGQKNRSDKAEKDPVYDITDKKENADTVLKDAPNGTSDKKSNGKGENGNKTETPETDGTDISGKTDGDASDGSGTSDRDNSHAGENEDNNHGSSGSDRDDHSGSDNKDHTDSGNGSNKPSKPTTPAATAKDPEITQKPTPDTGTMSNRQESYQEDKVTNETVKKRVIIQAGTSEDAKLYKGQTVDARMLYYALDTYVFDYSTPGNFIAYLWGEQDYGRYIQISGVSFDSEKTWISEFPVTIPENVEDGSMYIKVQYRLKQKDKWEETTVSYNPKATRLFLLSEKLQNENEELDTSKILNWDQYPESGSTLKLLSYVGKYFDWSGAPLEALLPGWMEDGEIVPWSYQITAGRHILEPADLIPLDPMYVVTLNYQWFGSNGRVDPDGFDLYYLQTLTGLNVEKYLKELEVPKYIQAVCLQQAVETETIRIPDTVLYIQNDGNGLRVNQSYEVDEQNSNYASEDGMLLNKEKTEILGIPYAKKEITISSHVVKVNLTADNQIETLTFEIGDLNEIPNMDLSKLSGCKVIVPDELLDSFLEQYGEVLTDSGNCVAASSDQEKTYVCHNGLVMDNQNALYRVLGYSGTAMRIPSDVTAIGSGAFQKAEHIHTLIWPEDAQIALCADSFAGSGVTKIICRSQGQFDELTMQLKELGITNVTLHVSGKSEDGFSYYSDTVEGDNGELISMLSVTEAPADVTEFRGAIQIDGKSVTVNQIEANAFSGCTQLKWVVLPETVDDIGYQAFRGCTSLEGVLIDTREQVIIGDEAFDGCSSLRFVASNAKKAQMQGDYDPFIYNQKSYDKVTKISYFFVPQGAEGYGYCANSLPEQKDVDHYEICETGTEGRILYGANANGKKWLALRSGYRLDSQTSLPETTSEIYTYAFEGSTGAEFQINWSGLPLTQIQEGAFYASALTGDVILGTEEEKSSLILENYVFSSCDQITSVTIPAELRYLGEMVFAGDGGLRYAEFDRAPSSVSCYANLFQGCNQLESITMDMESPMHLVTYGTMRFQFNTDWLPEEEKEHLRLIVPENSRQEYIMDWRYAFAGSVGAYSGCYYLDLWNSVQGDLLDWETMHFPSDEEVDVATKMRLLDAENRIRSMVGTDEVAEPTELYQFRLVGNNLTLVGVPSYRSEISLDPKTVDLPEGWFLDDIGAGAFVGTKNLTKVTIPANMTTIWSGALKGAATESGQVTLAFQGESPLILSGYTPDSPFAFGLEESKIRIQVPDGLQESYIRAWTYPLAGYADETAMEAAVREKVTNTEENGNNETTDSDTDAQQLWNQKVQEEMCSLLLPAENRLRQMMGMNTIEDPEDLICYDYVSYDSAKEAAETEEFESITEEQTTPETEESELSSESEPQTETKAEETECQSETEEEKETTETTESSASTETEADADEEIRQATEFTVCLPETQKEREE